MRKINISTPKYPNTFTLVDDEDYEYLNQWKWCCDGGRYVSRKRGWKGKQKKIYMHRLIISAKKGSSTDHVNRNKLDNRKCNLRVCAHKLNLLNIGVRKDNKSGYKGVRLRISIRNRKDGSLSKYISWMMNINFRGRMITVSGYKKPKEAAKAYNCVARILNGEYAYENKL